MKININNIDINYVAYTNENNNMNIVILHGWGANLNSFNNVINILKYKYNIYALDLPGFGESNMLDVPFNINDYADVIIKFLKKLNIKNPILIGHSFGGRIIIKLVGHMKLNVNKIILVDSAGIKPKRNLIYYFKIYSYKFLKKFKFIFGIKYLNYLRKLFGSSDYNMVNDVLKKTLINIVNEDLKNDIRKIKFPTLIIWGDKDNITPIKDAKRMNKLISDSGLVILKNAGHFSYLDKTYDFIKIISYFIDN